MAICHIKMSFCGFSGVCCPAAKLAYASGERLTDERTEKTWGYDSAERLKRIYGAPKVMTPDDAEMDSQEFLNMSQSPETRKDARVWELGIVMQARELTPEQNEAAARKILYENYVKHGYAVHYVMHDMVDDEVTGKKSQPHFHFAATLRPYEKKTRQLVGNKLQLNRRELVKRLKDQRAVINEISAQSLIENGFAPAPPPHSHVDVAKLEIEIEASREETAVLERMLFDAHEAKRAAVGAYAGGATDGAGAGDELPVLPEVAADETSRYVLALRRTNAVPAKDHRDHAAEQTFAAAECLRTDLYLAEVAMPWLMTDEDIKGLKRRAADLNAVAARRDRGDERLARKEARCEVAAGRGLSLAEKLLRFFAQVEYDERKQKQDERGHGG